MKLYDELAPWWPLISHPDEYEEEAALYAGLLREATDGPVTDVLELGSGGGNNAYWMKAAFALTLVEPAAGMRAVSEALNPGCVHQDGDMRTVRLGRTFDAVFVHDAITYMTSEADLDAAIATVAAHLRPGGGAVFAPDSTREAMGAAEDAGGRDLPDGRGVRFLEWSLPPAEGGARYEIHYAVLIREPGRGVRVVHDVHQGGVFARATWLALLARHGLRGSLVTRTFEGVDYDTFIARRA